MPGEASRVKRKRFGSHRKECSLTETRFLKHTSVFTQMSRNRNSRTERLQQSQEQSTPLFKMEEISCSTGCIRQTKKGGTSSQSNTPQTPSQHPQESFTPMVNCGTNLDSNSGSVTSEASLPSFLAERAKTQLELPSSTTQLLKVGRKIENQPITEQQLDVCENIFSIY